MYHLTLNKCEPLIDAEEIKEVATLLLHALVADDQAVALAAPQIGKQVRMFAMRPGIVVINPTYMSKSSRTESSEEGCRSLPNLGPVEVERHKSVKIRYSTLAGNTLIRTFYDYDAHIIQHEMDHLEGRMIHNAAE